MLKLILFLVTCGQFTVEVLPTVQRFTVAVQEPEDKPSREWYLVSETYCVHCPAAKAAFLAKGWPKQNILTIAECKAKFGITAPHVPYEFQEPEKSIAVTPDEGKSVVVLEKTDNPNRFSFSARSAPRTQAELNAESHLLNSHGISVSGLSLSEMKAIHDQAHGGNPASWHFPGRASIPATQPVSRVTSSCPGGVCRPQQQFTTRRRGLFGWRR